jgi:RNA polymerase sigma factor (sigma-70 family)
MSQLDGQASARVPARIAPWWARADDREDLAQEALTRAVEHGIDPESTAWLRTVARRVAIDKMRRPREIPSGAAEDMDGLFARHGSAPEDEVLAAERRDALRDAIGSLPPRYREAILAVAMDGGAASVAKQLNISPQATWTLLSRARGRLRRELERLGYAPAVIWARLHRWSDTIAAGGVAVGMAVTITLTAPVAPAPVEELRATTPAVASAPRVVEAAHTPAGVSTSPAMPAVAVAAPIDDITVEVKKPVEHGASVCTPEETGGTEVDATVWFDDTPAETYSERVAEALPSPAQRSDTGGCGS